MMMTEEMKIRRAAALVGGDPYRGLGRGLPHLMPMLGQWVCFKLDDNGRIICAGSGITPVKAYCDMNFIQ